MSALTTLEERLDDYFVREAPYQIPPGGREWVVRYGPWIALVSLVFMALAIANMFAPGAFAAAFVSAAGHNSLGIFYYPYVLLLFAQLILMAFAIPKLMKRRIFGWDLVFYYVLVGVVMSVVFWLPHPLTGLFGLLWSLIVNLVGFYILFQIRDYYH